MKRAADAWAIFLFLLAVPNAVLSVAGAWAAGADAEAQRATFFQRRVDAASDLKQEVELSLLRGAETLRAIPPEATAEQATAAMTAASNGFAVGFVIRDGSVVLPVPSDDRSPATDAATRDKALAQLMSDQVVTRLIRSLYTTIDEGRIQYVRTRSLILTTRDLHRGLRVGWLLDADTLVAGANAGLRALSLTLEPATLPAIAAEDSEALVNPDRDWNAKDATVRAITVSKGPARPATVATPEDATLLRVGTTLVFRVVPREPLFLEQLLASRSRKALGAVLGSLAFLDTIAIFLFWRARRAQRLAELRTDFVAAVSHELRTPLASVRMFAELLEVGAVPAEERPEVERALAGETRRLHATLERMLRFGALARGKLVVSRSRQLLAPLLADVAKRRAVVVDVDPSLEADVDGELVALALDNLLSNAAKYAPADDGAPHVVRARKERDVVTIDVIDHGPGLSKRACAKVFLPFERADHRLSRATEGSGVGLALVRGIARAHGGEASVRSDLGSGATFTLRLPCA